MKRFCLIMLICFVFVVSACIVGCRSTKVLTSKNIMAGFEAMYIAEKISEMPNATDWKIKVLVENSTGSLSFIGNGNSLKDAAKDLPNNLNYALPPLNIMVPDNISN